MSAKTYFLASVAALTLIGCGGGDDKASASDNTTITTASADASKGSPFDKKFKLSGASALDVDALFTSMGYTGEKFYGASNYDKATGATTLTDIRFDVDDGNFITIAKAELYGVDPGAIDQFQNGVATLESPLLSVAQKIRLYDLNFIPSQETSDNLEEVAFSVGGIEIDQLKLREGGIDKSAKEDTRFAQALNLFDLGGFYLKDLNFVVDSKNAIALKFSAPDFRLVGFGGGKLNALIANDLDYTIKQSKEALALAFNDLGPQASEILKGPLGAMLGLDGQRLTAKTLSWRDIDASKLLQYGLKGETPPMTEKNLISLGRGEMSNIEQFIGSKRLYSAKSSTFEMGKFTWLIPNVIRADIKEANYDLTAYLPAEEEELLGIMNKYGLNNIDGNGGMLWNYDDKDGTAKIDYSFNMKNFANFSMNFDANNLKYDEIATLITNEDQQDMLSIGNFKNFSLKIEDDHLLDMIFDITANQMGAGSGSDIRASAPAMLRLSSGQITQINPLFSGYVDALATFLSDGGTIEISANPEEDLPFAQLGIIGQSAPQTLPDVLGLKVTHKK